MSSPKPNGWSKLFWAIGAGWIVMGLLSISNGRTVGLVYLVIGGGTILKAAYRR